MPFGEALRLTQLLERDPSSMVCAALNDWDYPVSREALTLMDLFDLTHAANSSKQPKPYPRPYRDPNSKRRGRTDKSRAEVLAILRAHGHDV